MVQVRMSKSIDSRNKGPGVTPAPEYAPPPSSSGAEAAPLRICYWGAYRAGYSRNRIMIEGLRRNGVDVIECHETLWSGIDDRVSAVQGGWKRPAFWMRVARTYILLLRKFWRTPRDYDVLVVGYPGQFDVFIARLLSWWTGKLLVWDVFMSIYLIALERGLDRSGGPAVKGLYQLERVAFRLPDMLIQDTADYVQWLQATYGVSPARFRLVPTGADSDQFQPQPAAREPNEGRFIVTYYGSFIPNHGVMYMVEAARLLADHPHIHFELIGDGPTRPQAEALVAAYRLTNVSFPGWMDQNALARRVANADLCLGAFGDTPQSLMTVQNKIYECMAMQKPVVSGDSQAVRRVFTQGEHIFLCRRDDPQSLADAVRLLEGQPGWRAYMAEQGRRRFLEQFDIDHIGEQYAAHLREAVDRHRSRRAFTA